MGLTRAGEVAAKTVYIIPVREEIGSPLVYLVRRGVKEAMSAKADLIVLDMETNGGRVDSMIEIMESLNRFPGTTVTYVNKTAFSAGALISFATSQIYMAPMAVIGAAAPVMASPEGGVQAMADTMEIKSASAISAMVRAQAEKHGHNPQVVDKMMKKTIELVIDGQIINRSGDLLTLSDTEAAKEYGNPPKPLLSSGTVESLDKLIEQLGYGSATRVEIKATGVEKLGSWLNTLAPLLLIIGAVGIYIEFKTPGFGLPGVIGIIAFALYFLGGYIAGLSGFEWVLVFLLGVVMVALELFVFPGTAILGVIGAVLMLVALVMALADVYPAVPAAPGMPRLPQFGARFNADSFRAPLQAMAFAGVGTVIAILLSRRFLPHTAFYRTIASESVSGETSVLAQAERQSVRVGLEGVAISNLRPGGKAQFGDDILDVVTQGDLIEKGARVRILGHSATEAIVERLE
jgi:membrane-bound serine protease (ClpP class)